jgi:hypothetical protein
MNKKTGIGIIVGIAIAVGIVSAVSYSHINSTTTPPTTTPPTTTPPTTNNSTNPGTQGKKYSLNLNEAVNIKTP